MSRADTVRARGLRLACLGLALGLLAGLARAEPDIGVIVTPQPAEVGLLMKVDVTVTGAEGADCTLMETPVVDGASLERVRGPSIESRYTVVNGRQSQWVTATWSFRLVPREVGVLEIPPFRFNLRGEELTSQPTTVVVNESSGLLSEDVVSLTVVPSDGASFSVSEAA